MQKSDISHRKWKNIFPIADGRIKTLGGDQDLRTSTLVRHRPIQGESNIDFLRESEGSLRPLHDSFPDAGEAIIDFWSMSGNFINRQHIEPRIKLYSPREESVPTPLKYIDVSRTTHTNLDVKQERRIDDYWNIDGSRDLSDPWTGFTQFTLLEEKPPDGYMWSGRRLTRKQLTSRPDHLWPELWKSMGKHAKLKEKQKWSNEKLHLENARKLRGIYFIDPEDKEFKETIKNARKKLETSVAPAMPCKILKKNCWSGGSNKAKTKLACILEADESTRLRMGNSVPNHHEDHIAGKGDNSLQHYNLVHKFIPMPQAMKIPAAKAAVDKELDKLEKISAWNLTKVRSKKEVIDEARASGATVHFASLMDICHLKNAELEAKHPKIQRSRCTPRWYCERWFWILCSIHWSRFISITNDSSKSHGYHIQTARVRRSGSGCSICLYPGQNGRCSKIIENSKIGMSRHLDSSTTTQLAKIMVQYGRSSRSSWKESVRSSFGMTVIGKGNLRKSYWHDRLRNGPKSVTSDWIDDILHPSHMWIQTVLSCGKRCQTMQIGTVSWLRFCGRSWGLKIYFGWNIVCFWKSYICSNKLDVQETNVSFTQFNRIRNHFFGCKIEVG